MPWEQLLGHAFKGKRSFLHFPVPLPAGRNVDVMAGGGAATLDLKIKLFLMISRAWVLDTVELPQKFITLIYNQLIT